MHVAVIGAGALGTLFGARLADAGETVTLVGHPGRHLDAVARSGITVEGPAGDRNTVPVETTTDHDAVGDADWVLLAVKSYDTASAMADIADALSDQSVLTVQNGLGNAETIADFVPSERVVVGTTAHGASIPDPGHVVHAGTGETVVGRYFAANDDEVETIAEALTSAGIQTSVTDRPRDAIWEKVIVNTGINAATALARVPNGALVKYPPGERLLERAIEEGVAIARAEGQLIPDDVVARAESVARRTAPNRSSMRQDVEAGSRTEIEALNGAIVSLGTDHGIETPVNRTLADLIRLASTADDD